MKRVIIFGEQLMSNQSIKLYLETKMKLEVSFITDSNSTFFEFLNIKSNRPDIIIIDFSNFFEQCLLVIEELRRRRFQIPVLSIFPDIEYDYIYRLSKYKINGFIFKSYSLEDLSDAVNSILNNTDFFHPMLVPVFNTFLISHGYETKMVENLTNREKEILHYLSEGFSNKELAVDLSLSERTVKNHIFNLFRKINCSDRSQAILFALRNKV